MFYDELHLEDKSLPDEDHLKFFNVLRSVYFKFEKSRDTIIKRQKSRDAIIVLHCIGKCYDQVK